MQGARRNPGMPILLPLQIGNDLLKTLVRLAQVGRRGMIHEEIDFSRRSGKIFLLAQSRDDASLKQLEKESRRNLDRWPFFGEQCGRRLTWIDQCKTAAIPQKRGVRGKWCGHFWQWAAHTR